MVHQEGGFVAFFPLNVSMVHSLKLIIVANGNNLTSVGFALGKTICFRSLEFTTNHFGDLNLSHEGNDSAAIFLRMIHSRLPSLHMVLEESTDGDDTTSNGRGSSGLPIPRGCNVVTPTVPITTTPPLENTPALLAIPIVSLHTIVPQPNTELPSN
jgi:hypothetical protein